MFHQTVYFSAYHIHTVALHSNEHI